MNTIRPPRPSWDQYFMDIAHVAATRSNPSPPGVSAFLVRGFLVVSTVHSAPLCAFRNCSDGGCPRCNSDAPSGTNLHQCLCSHAEENAIVQAAYHGIAVKGATLYTTFSPCLLCAKMIINAGIVEVVYHRHYSIDDVSMGLLREAGVIVRALETKHE